MKKILFILVLVLSAVLGGISAYAAGTLHANLSSGTYWCYHTLLTSSDFVGPIVQCFTDTAQGIIPSVTRKFLATATVDYLPVVGILLLLATVFHGYRLMTGDLNQNLKGSAVILLLKMGAIYFFMYNAAMIYGYMVGILQNLSEKISQVASAAHTTAFCNNAYTPNVANNSQWQNGMWARWDCFFHYLLGLNGTLAENSIISFLFLMIFTMGTGILVCIMGLFIIASLLMAAFKFIHVYVTSLLSLSFMFCLGYLFVPLILFRVSYQYFRQWLSLVIGYIITPIIMFGFMGVMLVAMDVALFTGKYSVWCTIGGPANCGANAGGSAPFMSGPNWTAGGTGGKYLFANITQFTGTDRNAPNRNMYLEDAFKGWFWMSHNGPAGEEYAAGPGGNGLGPNCNDSVPTSNAGTLGFICNLQQNGSTFDSNLHSLMSAVGVHQTSINLDYLAGIAGSSCKQTHVGAASGQVYYTQCPYIEDVLLSMAVAALLTYVMFALLSYIPQLASNISSELMLDGILSTGRPGASFVDTSKAQSLEAGKKASGTLSDGLTSSARSGMQSMIGKRQ